MSNVIMIRKSCLTGKVIWLYQGQSVSAARMAYSRACKKEIERVKHWNKTVEQRRANILRILSECTSSFSIDAEMTQEQKEAAKHLQAYSAQPYPCNMDFYNHVMEERRLRKKNVIFHFIRLS